MISDRSGLAMHIIRSNATHLRVVSSVQPSVVSGILRLGSRRGRHAAISSGGQVRWSIGQRCARWGMGRKERPRADRRDEALERASSERSALAPRAACSVLAQRRPTASGRAIDTLETAASSGDQSQGGAEASWPEAWAIFRPTSEPPLLTDDARRQRWLGATG